MADDGYSIVSAEAERRRMAEQETKQDDRIHRRWRILHKAELLLYGSWGAESDGRQTRLAVDDLTKMTRQMMVEQGGAEPPKHEAVRDIQAWQALYKNR